MAVPALPETVVWSPVLVPDKLATAELASISFVIAPLAMDVAFPTEVTGPVKFALVVTEFALVAVAAFPVILPTIGLVTVKFAKVPTLVKLEPVIVDFKVVPDNVPALRVAHVAVPLPSMLSNCPAVELWAFG